MENGLHRQSSLRDKLISSICCFSGSVHAHHEPLDHGEMFYNKLHPPRTPPTPNSPAGSWLKKSPTSECGDHGRLRGRSSMSRKGRRHHRQSQSADFSYDPSSYALNFEDDSRADDDMFPLRNFSSRLPPSPPPLKYSEELPVSVMAPTEIVGFS